MKTVWAAAMVCAWAAVPASAAPWDRVDAPLVLPIDSMEAAVTAELELSARLLGEPISLAPDLAVGATRGWTLGVTHSARSLGRIDAGNGVCVSGTEHGCPRAYDNVVVDARWLVRGGDLAVAAHPRLGFRSFDPAKPWLGLGILAKLHLGRWALSSDPYVALGLLHRDRGNRATFDLPVWVTWQPVERCAFHLQTGVRGELAVFGDAYTIPVGGGVAVSVHRAIDLVVDAGFPRLLGPRNDFRARMASVSLIARWP